MSPPTVILGAGIIGVSTAYYLSQEQQQKQQDASNIHLVDPSPELFSSASGFAGGFLAQDWFGTETAALGALSFREHRRLAEEHGGREKWGYSPSTCFSYAASVAGRDELARGDDWLREGTSRAEAAPPDAVGDGPDSGGAPAWLRRVDGDHVELIGDPGTAAQADPFLLCQFLLKECLGREVQLHHPARPVSVLKDENGQIAGIRIADAGSARETELPCERLIITAGAWTGQVFKTLFPTSEIKIPIKSLAGHSLLVKSPRWHRGMETDGCHAVFTNHSEGFCPEVFSRLGGHIYFAGLNSSTLPLPDGTTGKAMPYKEDIALLRRVARDMLGPGPEPELGAADNDGDVEVIREALCFRPVTPWGRPIITRIPDRHLGAGTATRPGVEGGVYLAAGHGPWGIALSLGTGLVMADMLQGRTPRADVKESVFDPDAIADLSQPVT
ncbi:hypothetical protein VTJ49DRAFT_6853 [Mycothermus thermophilus]|uniref:FAD dependent oxidoreductase domain-containing protein n=1 Tax=Humicola insolens TaxID=85995 RepID=A0ABR3VQZ0_HUMIN